MHVMGCFQPVRDLDISEIEPSGPIITTHVTQRNATVFERRNLSLPRALHLLLLAELRASIRRQIWHSTPSSSSTVPSHKQLFDEFNFRKFIYSTECVNMWERWLGVTRLFGSSHAHNEIPSGIRMLKRSKYMTPSQRLRVDHWKWWVPYRFERVMGVKPSFRPALLSVFCTTKPLWNLPVQYSIQLVLRLYLWTVRLQYLDPDACLKSEVCNFTRRAESRTQSNARGTVYSMPVELLAVNS